MELYTWGWRTTVAEQYHKAEMVSSQVTIEYRDIEAIVGLNFFICKKK